MLKNWLEQRRLKKAEKRALAERAAQIEKLRAEKEAKGNKTISLLHEMIDKTHAPYVDELFQAKFPINLMEIPEETMGFLLTDIFDGTPVEMYLNTQYKSIYSLCSTTVHETIHWKQHTSKNILQYHPWRFAKPQQAFKVDSLTEMNARGSELYKLVIDYAAGHTKSDEIRIAYEESSGMLCEFIQAYNRKKTPVNCFEIYGEMSKIKNAGKVKPAEEVLPEFYYKVSQSASYKNMFITDHLRDQARLFSNLATDPQQAAELVKKMKQDSLQIGDGFTVADADNVLGWDGSHPIRTLDPKKQKEFLRNISSLDNHQRQQIESFKQQANGYLL